MKIWYSGGTQPRIEKHLRKVARADTEIVPHAGKAFTGKIIYYRYAAYLHTAQEIESAIQAEREGYDAWVRFGLLDLGLLEIREAVDIPVVFATEASLHVAALLAPKVAFLALNRPFLNKLNEMAKFHGFQERMTPGGCANFGEPDVRLAFENPGPFIETLEREAKKVAEQGADILIVANNMVPLVLMENGVTELAGIPFLDSVGVPIKVAEMMVDLHKMGITRKKMGLYAPMPKEELANIRKVYGME